MKLPVKPRRSKKTKALGAVRANPVKAVGALTLIGGLAAAAARKLRGGAEPDPFAASPYEPADAAATTNGGAAPAVAAVPDPVVDVAAAVAEVPEAVSEEAAAPPVAAEPEAAAEEPAAEEPADEEPAAEERAPEDEPRRGPPEGFTGL